MFKEKIYNLSILYIFLCICLHIISCYFSIGFYSDDEHFQILEPAAYLLGINDVVINDRAMYDGDSSVTTNFELHASEENELVYKILKLAGVSMKRDDMTTAGQGLESMQIQQEKQ